MDFRELIAALVLRGYSQQQIDDIVKAQGLDQPKEVASEKKLTPLEDERAFLRTKGYSNQEIDYMFQLRTTGDQRNQQSNDIPLCDFEVMTGWDFEKYLEGVCRDTFRYDQVELTQQSSDQGVDLVLTAGQTRIAVQAKRYSGRVGNDAVQQVFAGASYYGCSRAVVVTNSTFSQKAVALAERCKVVLVDGDFLENLIRSSAYQPF